jgi:CubicO group peptidase (beta-lactamase class C family)
MSSEKLEALGRKLEAKGTKAFLVVRHDKIVYERYATGFGRNQLHHTASLAKALIGGTSLILALGDGYLSPDDTVYKYILEWRDDPTKSRITIRHLATHSSGISDMGSMDGWMSLFWTHPSRVARDVRPVAFKPGTGYEYTNLGMGILSYCISAALRGAPEPDIKMLIANRVMKPLGVPDDEWNMSYGKSAKAGDLTLYANWGGANFTPDALARVGRLMLRKGEWNGKQILDPEWVEKATSDAGTPAPNRANGPAPRSGLCWWVNSDGVWDKVPRNAFAGAGAGNQLLLVVPSLDLIVVRNGAQIDRSSFWHGIEQQLLNPLMEAVGGSEMK